MAAIPSGAQRGLLAQHFLDHQLLGPEIDLRRSLSRGTRLTTRANAIVCAAPVRSIAKMTEDEIREMAGKLFDAIDKPGDTSAEEAKEYHERDGKRRLRSPFVDSLFVQNAVIVDRGKLQLVEAGNRLRPGVQEHGRESKCLKAMNLSGHSLPHSLWERSGVRRTGHQDYQDRPRRRTVDTATEVRR